MALINGNDYDHIDFTKNGVTTRHMLKDALSRQMSGDLVKVQNEEPTSEGTKIWIKPSGDSEVQVPTYEEFEELSDKIDDADATIESLAVSAQPTVSVTEVDGHKRFSFGIPASNGIASITKTATDGVIDTYTIAMTDGTSTSFSVNNSDITPESMAEAIATALQDYARIDGYYPDLTAGNADQLNSTKFVENKEPYLYRPSGGTSDIGNRKYLDAIVGVSLPWNQMVRDEASENSTDFADIVTVTDAVEDAAGVRVQIEPVQDLHGYDHPWPAGGGKNLCALNDFTTTKRGVTFAYVNGKLIVNGTPESAGWFGIGGGFKLPAGTYTVSYTVSGNNPVIKVGFDNFGGYIQFNTSGTQSRTFTLSEEKSGVFDANCDQLTAYSNTQVLIQIETGSSATSWTPYSNICPITGWTGANVWDDPKHGGLIEWNQLMPNPSDWLVQAGNPTLITDATGGTLTVNATRVSAYDPAIRGTGSTNVSVVGHKYLIDFEFCTPDNVSDTNPSVYISTSAFPTDSLNGVSKTGWNKYSKIKSSTTAGLIISYIGLSNAVNVLTQGDRLQFRNVKVIDLTQMLGSAIADYIYSLEQANAGAGVAWFRHLFLKDYYAYNAGEVTTVSAVNGDPYSHIDITFPFEAGTVYGGELTVNADGSGQLVVDRAMVDLGTLAFSYDSSGKRWQILVPDIVSYPSRNANILAEKYAADITAIAGDIGKMFTTGKDLYIYDIDNENAPSGSFVYPLAIPITYTLTASEIRTLLGENNVWADTGVLALTYTGTDEHLTLESGKKYLSRISGTDSMLLGLGQEITAVKGTDNVFDLTQMFGTAVADYVYGQGVAFFRKWFGKQWYPYNAGELLSVEGLQSHDMVGFNAFNKNDVKNGVFINDGDGSEISATGAIATGWIPVIGGATYYIKSDATSGNWGAWYDADEAYISGTYKGLSTAPVNAAYLRFTVKNTASSLGSPDTLCINLSHNGSRNGEYAPYEKHSYPLDSSVILRGIPKVDSNGVYWDGDRYLPDGTVERKYGVVDLGTLTWSKEGNLFKAWFDNSAIGRGSIGLRNVVCSKYPLATTGIELYQGRIDKAFLVNATYISSNKGIFIRDTSYDTAAAFKSAMQGVLLVYELAEPTIEQATPYRNFQLVDDWGTEEFVTTGIIPVGHESRYPANLRDKLQHLPDAASSNGSYLITQTDGQMTLTPFPAPPTTAGKYALRATVTNGVATFTWEATT